MSLFSWLRSKVTPVTPTFNARVSGFWQWYIEVAPRFLTTIENGRCASLTGETSRKVDEFFPGMSWVFGRGAGGHGHSFTLTGEGNLNRQLLTQQWLAQAPTLEGWTFHAARQPDRIKGHVIEMGGMRFDPKEIWVTTALNAERECLDLTVWHPLWEKIPDSQRTTITFLFLDEALGEYGTEWWVGRVDYGRDKLGEAFPLEELADHVDTAVRERGWKKFPPGQSLTLYRTKGRTIQDFPRADVLTQSTAVPGLFREFVGSMGELTDPLAGFGADYVYVSIDRAFFPAGEEVAALGRIEDAIERTLTLAASGRCIGGAMGSLRCYSDFLIFDGPRSLEIIRQTLRDFHVPAGTTIEFFAREKRAQRIIL